MALLSIKVDVPTAAPVTVTGADFGLPYDVLCVGPITVTAKPGAGGTLKVESRTHVDDDWAPWAKGSAGVVSAADTALMTGPVQAIRLTAADEPGTAFFARPLYDLDT
jgi:hypothetical protein